MQGAVASRGPIIALATLLAGVSAVAPVHAQDVSAACERDIQRLCRNEKAPDEGRILACLSPDRARLSPACRHAQTSAASYSVASLKSDFVLR